MPEWIRIAIEPRRYPGNARWTAEPNRPALDANRMVIQDRGILQ
jgi:hypothetical protein